MTTLGIVLLVLKVTGVITWPWLLVLAPFWAPLAVFTLLSVVLYVLAWYGYA